MIMSNDSHGWCIYILHTCGLINITHLSDMHTDAWLCLDFKECLCYESQFFIATLTVIKIVNHIMYFTLSGKVVKGCSTYDK